MNDESRGFLPAAREDGFPLPAGPRPAGAQVPAPAVGHGAAPVPAPAVGANGGAPDPGAPPPEAGAEIDAGADGGLPDAGTAAGIALPGSSTDLDVGAPPAAPPAANGRAKRGGALVERASLAVFWNAAFLPLKLLAKLGASIVVIRWLRGDGFEILTQVGSLLALLGTVTDLGLERALPRFIPEFEMSGGRAGLNRLLLRVSLLKVLTMLPFVGGLLLFPGFLAEVLQFHPEEARLLNGTGRGLAAGPPLLGLIAAMLVLGAASDVSIQVLYAYFRQKATSTLDVLNTMIPVLQALLVLPFRVFGALFALLIGTAISVALSLGLMFRALAEERLGVRADPGGGPNGAPARVRQVPHRPSNRSTWQRFTAYSAMMYVMNLSTALYDQSFVVLLIGIIIADSNERRIQVGLIGLTFKFVRQLLQALVVPLTGVQTPLFSRLYAENRMEGLRTAYASLTRFLILVLVPAGAGLIIMTRNLLVLLYVQQRADAVLTENRLPETVFACAILTIGLFGESLVSVALNVLMVHEDYRAVLIARSCSLVSVPLLLLLEPPLGVVGVAIAVAAAALSSRLVALGFGLRRLGLRFPGAFLGRVGLATLGFSVVVGPLALLLPDDPGQPLSPTWFLLAAADGVLVLGAVLLFWLGFRRLGGVPAEDKARFAGMRIPGIKLLVRYL